MYIIGEFVPLDKVKKIHKMLFVFVYKKKNDMSHLLEYDGNTLNTFALGLKLIYVPVSFLEPKYDRCRFGICKTPRQKVRNLPFQII